MVKTSVNIALEEALLKTLDAYCESRPDKPSRSTIIGNALQKELFILLREKKDREGLEISVDLKKP